MFVCYNYLHKCGQLTQLGECLLDVEEVTGSSPVLSTSRYGLLMSRNRKEECTCTLFSFLSLLVLRRPNSYQYSRSKWCDAQATSCFRYAVASLLASPVLSTNRNLKRTPLGRIVLGFFFLPLCFQCVILSRFGAVWSVCASAECSFLVVITNDGLCRESRLTWERRMVGCSPMANKKPLGRLALAICLNPYDAEALVKRNVE